jgi:predicted dithiol-disulfide oxidoreductase (DUF899 family)
MAHPTLTGNPVVPCPDAQAAGLRPRLGWSFKWDSSSGNDFNYDFNVSFRPETLARCQGVYNYEPLKFESSDMRGVSVFAKDPNGARGGTTRAR